jgi:hypothetical protein
VVKFSVVIPCFNQGPFLQECLESVRRQTLPAFEVVVVDDGSTDPYTVQRIDELCVAPIKLVRQVNRGLSAARNAGVEASTGDWILPLDADDQLTEDALASYAEEIAQHPDVDIFYPDIAQFGLHHEVLRQPEFDPWRLLWNNHLVCSSAIRRQVFGSGIHYNEKMRQGYEDWEFYIHACCERDFKGRRLRKAVFRYRRWGYSMIAASDDRRAEVIDQMRRRPVFSDEDRLDALKRQWSPFFSAAVSSGGAAAALEEQSFRDLRVIDRTGAVLRAGHLEAFREAPGSHLLISLDDHALVAAACSDRALLEKLALGLRARPPGLTWLVESANVVPGTQCADGRRIGLVVPLSLFFDRPLLRATGGGLAADLSDHAAAVHAPVRTVGVGGDGRIMSATPPEAAPSGVGERFRNGFIAVGRDLSWRARKVLGPDAHDRLWSQPLLKRALHAVDRASALREMPQSTDGLLPGPIPVERSSATDARLRLIAKDAPRLAVSVSPSLMVAVPRLGAAQVPMLLALLDRLRVRSLDLPLLVVTTDSTDVSDARTVLPHLDGLFALAEIARRDDEPGTALADLVRRHAVRGLVIDGARDAFVALPALAREPVRPRVVARLDEAGPGSLGEEMAARFNNLIDAYLLRSTEVGEQLTTRCYVSPSKLWSGSFDEQVDVLLRQIQPPPVSAATRHRGELR